MNTNVGSIDRVIRIVIGLVVLSLPFWLNTPLRWLGLIGVIPIVTGLAGRCPGYCLFGLSTCPLLRKPE